jgi:hypothetical protein
MKSNHSLSTLLTVVAVCAVISGMNAAARIVATIGLVIAL